MGIVAIIFLVLGFASFGYLIFRAIKISKTHEPGEEKYKLQGRPLYELLISCGATGFLFALSGLFLILLKMKTYQVHALQGLATVFGALLSGVALSVALGSFILFYYKLDIDEKQKKFFKYAFPLGFVALFLGLYIFSEGIANLINYPLPNGISTGDGITYPGEMNSGLSIRFYGILIVSGALLCYAITDHMLYQKFKKHGLIDTLFILAFIFGILGARLWYCIVLEPDYYFGGSVPPLYFLYGIVDGGLAVQGGAILGGIAGIAYVLIFRRYIGVRRAMDIAIPPILLAQAIGRWGNFFNQEVYGTVVSREALWFVPTIVKNNMLIDGEYRVPLFYIESLINIIGYIVIRYGLGKASKLKCGLGFQASAYLVWYGLVRVLLEPLREGYHASTNTEGFGYLQSYITAFAMIGVGLLMALGFFLFHYMRMKKGLEDKFGEKI